MVPTPRLDEEELLHLAMEASNERRHGDAIDYLKQAVERSSSNYKALYLLGAQHAQIGMTERAIEEFNRALELEPNLQPARFQLGLLLLCNARVDEALAALQPLGKLGEGDPYQHFGRGLESLIRDDFAACKESMRRGMELNTANPALNADMQQILDRIAEQVDGGGAAAPKPGAQQPAHMLISAYTKGLN